MSKGNQTVSIVSRIITLSISLLFFEKLSWYQLVSTNCYLLSSQLESCVSSLDLESVLMELCGLREFLDKNSQFSPSSLGAAR